MAAALRHRPLSATPRLAALVRGHVEFRALSLDAAPDLEAAAQRPGDAEAPGERSLPRCAAALRPRPVLPLRVRPARRSRRRLVETHAARLVDPSPVGERPAARALPRRLR